MWLGSLVACGEPDPEEELVPPSSTSATPDTAGLSAPSDTATGTVSESGSSATGTGDTAVVEQCVYPIELWCFNREYPPGPSQTTGTCPTVTLEALVAQAEAEAEIGLYDHPPTRLRCEEQTHGTLDYVNQWTGHGGPNWYFDASGALVVYQYGTDYDLCPLPGSDSYVYYGFAPRCLSWCEVSDPTGFEDHPPCP